MLVLSRKPGESLIIGDGIVVKLKKIAGSRVTIAIDAPKDVPIRRGEIKNRSKPDEDPDHGNR